MIAFIKGQVEGIAADKLVIENNGIGYNIFVTTRLLADISVTGKNIKLYTYLGIKEDSMSLYGFSTMEELELFKKLIGVNGIGPKGALGLLSFMTIEELRLAIVSDDTKAISRAPGIGAKTASRIIMELKDKIDITDIFGEKRAENGETGNYSMNENVRNDAVEALVALGYSPSQALTAVRNVEISESDSVEIIIKNALKKLI